MAQVKDPVCGMMINEQDAVSTSDYKGKRYHFCSQDCKTEFDASPDEYADKAGNASGGSSGH